MKFTVTIDGTEHEVGEPGISDLVAFERQFDQPASILTPDEDEQGEVRFEWLTFLVFRGLRKEGVLDKRAKFDDDFLDSIEEIDLIVDDDDDEEESEESDPTE